MLSANLQDMILLHTHGDLTILIQKHPDMPEDSSKNSQTSLQQEIRSNLSFFRPVVKNGWVIKFSVSKDTGILLFIISKYTGQTIIRFYEKENSAVNFINMILEKDASFNYDDSLL